MCGIFFHNHKVNFSRKSVDRIRKRGPDEFSTLDSIDGFFMMARLAITASDYGQQPYQFQDKLVVLFNGEIYNYKELAESLGLSSRGLSEVKTIAALFVKFGKEFAKKLEGFFSIIIKNRETGEVIFVRDRLGIKPLYYLADLPNERLVVGSDPRLLAEIECDVISDDSLVEAFVFGYPIQSSPYRKVLSADPGVAFVFDSKCSLVSKSSCYDKFNEQKTVEQNSCDPTSIVNHLKSNILAAVPAEGLFSVSLSGGIDSTLVAETCREFKPVAFTLNLGEANRPDWVGSRRSCEKLGLELVEVKPNLDQFDVGDLVEGMHYPILDSGYLAQHFLYQSIRSNSIKTVLSGVGGDELFFGYPRYHACQARLKLKFLKEIKTCISPQAFALLLNSKSDVFSYLLSVSGHKFGYLRKEKQVEFIGRLSERIDFGDVDTSNKHWRPLLDHRFYLQKQLFQISDNCAMWHAIESRPALLGLQNFDLLWGHSMSYYDLYGQSPKNQIEKYLSREIGYQRISKSGFTSNPLVRMICRLDEFRRGQFKSDFCKEFFDHKIIQSDIQNNLIQMPALNSLFGIYVLDSWIASL